MLFNSYSFIFLFLPVALCGYLSVGRFGRRYGAIWLALVSFAFYGLWNPNFIFLLLGSIAFNFSVGEMIHANIDRPSSQRMWLVIGIVLNLVVLIYYKYLAALVGIAVGLGLRGVHTPEMLLPLGISFFTFTQIGYLVDLQQGVVRERGLLNYILFVTFFPHLIAGPILHNREIMPQFAEERTYKFSIENLTVGLVIFVIGLAKKCLFADPIASRVAMGFAAPGHLTAVDAWMLMMTYAAQLYFDFSGYTDMAIGIARMFNVRFPMNFNSPYKASSIIEFWQCWHMTLTRFLMLYLFNPIALIIARRRAANGLPIDRTAQARPLVFLQMVSMPIFVTMTLAGIWHGAGLKFLIFGMLHGVYLSINHAWRMMRPARKAASTKMTRLSSQMLTLAAILFALVFFRAPSLTVAYVTLQAMAGLHGLGSVDLISAPKIQAAETVIQTIWIGVLWFIIWIMPNTQQILHRFEPVLGRVSPSGIRRLVWQPTIGWAAALGVTCAVAVLAIGGTTEFVYYQF